MKRFLSLILTGVSLCALGQMNQTSYYSSPVNIPMFLTGNFGELRGSHFHGGIDIKTEGRTGLPVFAAAEGYISRMSVSPYGFGHALYIDHPNGTTTVYAHLDAFAGNIQQYLRDRQYEKESFILDISLLPGQFPVKKGELVAYSGNTGSSGGPHVHFEIRTSRTQRPVNPLHYQFPVKDSTSPKILSVVVYPLSDDAVVAGTAQKQRYETVFYNQSYSIQKNPVILVYGTIGFGIQAIDYLDGNWSKCGIYKLILKVDGQTIYSFTMDEFGFDESRYINSLTDYDQKIRFGRSLYKTWNEPGNKLSIIDRKSGDGFFTFNDDKKHQVSYEITDVYGNLSKLNFEVIAKKQTAQREVSQGILFEYDDDNEYETDDIELDFPEGIFYSNFNFIYNKRSSVAGTFSEVHQVHNKYTPVHDYFSIKINAGSLPENLRDKALLAYVDPQTNALSALGGEYKNGWVSARSRTLGDIAIAVDTIAPTIVPLSLKNGTLTEATQIRFRIKDNFSGIERFRGTIDDKWVLFELDGKSNLLVYKFDKTRFEYGKKHQLKLEVVDLKGNIKTYESSFYK